MIWWSIIDLYGTLLSIGYQVHTMMDIQVLPIELNYVSKIGLSETYVEYYWVLSIRWSIDKIIIS